MPLDFDFHGSDADYTVRSEPLFTHSGKVHTHKAQVRDGKVVGVVGEKYKTLQNADFFGTIETALNNVIDPARAGGMCVATDTSFGGGFVERRYTFPGYGNNITTNTGWTTKTGFEVIAWNSHDGSSAAGTACGMIDFFCHNGCITGDNVDLSKKRHTSGLTADHFANLIYSNMDRIETQMQKLNNMANTILAKADAEDFLKKVFSERRAAKMVEQLEEEIQTRGENVFALHSALTYFASHDSERFGVRNTGNDNVARTIFNRRNEVARILKGSEFNRLLEAA